MSRRGIEDREAGEDLEVFWVEKVVAKGRKLVYNVWTTGDLQKSAAE